MRVYLGTNTVYCFAGSCVHAGKSMDVIDFIMYMGKCSKHAAILKAKDLAGGMPAMPKKVVQTPKIESYENQYRIDFE